MKIEAISFYLEEEGTLTPQIRQSTTKAITSEPGVRYYGAQSKEIFVNERFIAFDCLRLRAADRAVSATMTALDPKRTSQMARNQS